jgi:DNA-directed RNA polymerase specialized sigma24 family protein
MVCIDAFYSMVDNPPAVTLRNDTLFVVWDKAGDFRSDSRVSTWIMGIAYRRGLNLLRAKYRADERMVLPTTEHQHLRDPGDYSKRAISAGTQDLLRDPFVAQEVTHLNRELWWDWLLSTGL